MDKFALLIFGPGHFSIAKYSMASFVHGNFGIWPLNPWPNPKSYWANITLAILTYIRKTLRSKKDSRKAVHEIVPTIDVL